MYITLVPSDKLTQCVSILIREASKMIYIRTVQGSGANDKDDDFLAYLHYVFFNCGQHGLKESKAKSQNI